MRRAGTGDGLLPPDLVELLARSEKDWAIRLLLAFPAAVEIDLGVAFHRRPWLNSMEFIPRTSFAALPQQTRKDCARRLRNLASHPDVAVWVPAIVGLARQALASPEDLKRLFMFVTSDPNGRILDIERNPKAHWDSALAAFSAARFPDAWSLLHRRVVLEHDVVANADLDRVLNAAGLVLDPKSLDLCQRTRAGRATTLLDLLERHRGPAQRTWILDGRTIRFCWYEDALEHWRKRF